MYHRRFRRRRFPRRKRFSTRGKFARRSITSRIRHRPRNRVQSVVHRYDSVSPLLSSQNLADSVENLAFTLAEFPGTGPFQNLYHQYRFTKVKVEFIPCNSQARYQLDGEQPTATFTPSLYTAVNRTASAFAASVSDFMSMNSVKYTLAGRYHKRYFSPCTLDQVYGSAVQASYNPEYNQWISTAYPRTPHFGLGCLLAASGSSPGSYKYRLVVTAYVQYKNRKPNTDTAVESLPPSSPRALDSSEPQASEAPPFAYPEPRVLNPSEPKASETVPRASTPIDDPCPDLASLHDEIKLKRAQLLEKLV